ncbi:MAG: hypothetical protein R3Y22_04575 [Bacteroidales bacterium]
MNYIVEDVMRDVRIAINENSSYNELLELDADTLTIDKIISQKLTFGVKMILQVAPLDMIDSEASFADSEISWYSDQEGKGSGTIELPKDFMRFVIFKMSDWRMPVINPIYDTDIDYYKQSSAYTGIRGNVNKPVCVLTKNSNGQVLEFYSCSGGEGVYPTVAKYIPIPTVVDGVINIPEMLYMSTVYQIAGLTAMTYKDSLAQTLFGLASSDIQSHVKGT